MRGRYDRWTRLSALTLAILFLGFGAVTVVRSAYQQVRKTDLTVYLRGAWAVRTGEDLYAVTDEHGWHYHYPPTLAAALVPFAQPPAGSDATPLVPFASVVALWYAVGVACVLAAVGLLAPAVGGPAAYRDGRYRYWLVHAPLWVLVPALGSSLGRGQVNEIVLLFLAGMTVSALAGRRFAAGVWLSAAVAVKVFPAFLLVYPLWKRDWKWLGGTAAGLVLTMLVVPGAVVGPARTAGLYADWVHHVIRPGLTEDIGTPRSRELLNMTATDNQSFQGALHNIRHLDRATRPRAGDLSTRVVHWFLAALTTVITLSVARRSAVKEPQREALTIGALTVPMLLSCPVCHLHYFVLLLPLIVALVGSHLVSGKRVRPALAAVLVLNFLTALLPRIPGLEVSRDVGLASVGALALWAAALIELSGEAIVRVQLPGYRRARAFWSRKRMVTVHGMSDGTRTVATPRRRGAGH